MRFVACSWRCWTVILFAAWCAIVAPGQVAAPPDARNAATWYQRAIDQFLQLPESQRELLLDNWDPSMGPPPAELRAAVGKVQSILTTFQRGSNQEYCDFNLDRSQGFDLMLPHLNQLRQIAKLARTDVLIRLQDGDSGGAADRMASLYRMSGHNGGDEILISSLVGAVVFKMADGLVQSAIDQGLLNAADSGKLLHAAETLGTNDPFQYGDAIAGEQEIAIGWLQTKAGEEGGLLTALQFMGAHDNPHAAAIMAMDEATLEKSLEAYDVTMNRVVEAFAMQDHVAGKAQLDDVLKEVEAGVHGPIVMVLLPAFGRIFDGRDQAEKMVADRIAILEKLAAGQVKPEEAANAAIWYFRGIELLEKIEPAKLQSMRAFAADVSQTINEDLAATLKDKATQDVIDVFRDGSIKKRCNFDLDNSAGRNPILMPAYAVGMNDALRLIRTDAMRLLRAGDVEGAVDRLALTFRVIGHLNGDPQLLSSLIAHRNFTQALAIIETALSTKAIPEQSKPVLLESLDRVSRKDPFGYLGAMVATRQALAKRLHGMYTAEADEHNRRAKAVETVSALSGDQLLYLLAVQDTMIRAGKASEQAAARQPEVNAAAPPAASQPDAAAAAPDDPFTRMSDVISLGELEAVRNDVANVAPQLAKFDFDLFTDRTIPLIGNIGDGVKRARADVRRARAMLEPPPTDHSETKAPAEANSSPDAPAQP